MNYNIHQNGWILAYNITGEEVTIVLERLSLWFTNLKMEVVRE